MGEQGSYGVAALILGAFGIAVPMPNFVGGMIVALGCSFAVMAMRPLEKRRTVALTLLMGTLASIIAAMLHKATGDLWIWGRIPIQVQMGLSGLLSQAAFEVAAAKGPRFMDALAEKFLPKGENHD